MHKIKRRPLMLVCVATLTLAACGGNDDEMAGMADDPGQVPASATASVAAFTAYVGGLPATDVAEPLMLTGLVPPVSDSVESSTRRPALISVSSSLPSLSCTSTRSARTWSGW